METNDSTQPPLINHALKFGAILSVISMVIVLLLYAVDYTILATLGFVLLVIAIGIGYVIYAGINYRNSIGGHISYIQAFLHALAVLGISGLIYMGFNLLLYNVIDPELPQNLTEIMLANQEALLTKFNTPQAELDIKMAELRADLPNNFTTVGLIIGYFKAYIGYVIIALIVGLIVRKRKPESNF